MEMQVAGYQSGQIPRLCVLRRVSARYYRILPLEIMERYQCVVVGSARGILTVAITERQDLQILKSLSLLTGHEIFPVLVDSEKVRLLIRRIKLHQKHQRTKLRRFSFERSFQSCSAVLLLNYQERRPRH